MLNNCHLECQEVHHNIQQVVSFISYYYNYFEIKLADINYIASINVVRISGQNEWENAAWFITNTQHKQLLFGQRTIDNRLLSCGTDIMIVAHECCHALISQKKNFDNPNANPEEITIDNLYDDSVKYKALSLEESLCDIFAVLFVNYNANHDNWCQLENWQWNIVGRSLNGTIDPELARGYNLLSFNQDNYHELSLIHSHAFYIFMTAQHQGQYLFDGLFALKLFSLSIRQHISDPDFLKSRRVFEKNARILLRDDPLIQVKLTAIAEAFDRVGITQPN